MFKRIFRRVFASALDLFLLLALLPPAQGGFIRYVEFNPTLPVLRQAMEYDIAAHTASPPRDISWIDLLAYAAAKTGGKFEEKRSAHIDALAARLNADETLAEITKDLAYFSYYQKAYGAVLAEFLGWHEIEVPGEGGIQIERRYGLKAFCPIAQGFGFSHYPDFGADRSYGYRRPHLGNDLFGETGTPIVAVEGGIVEAIGWNRYGGWRIGIRSFDGKRYYYYAHLRAKHPYHLSLDEGSIVSAGDVIGYMGRTGYSDTPGESNIETTHLHFGLQLIFDESQKDGVNQIWVDVYALTELLLSSRVSVKKTESGDYARLYRFADRSPTQEECLSPAKESYLLPVLMYHSLIPDPSRYGEYVIPPSLLEKDLALLKSLGYNTVSARQLLDFVDRGLPLPDKPVLLSFDDGYYNNFVYLPPLLEKYGMCAVVAAVGCFTDLYTEKPDKNIYYGVASWEELSFLENTGRVEIASHSFSQHEEGALAQGEAFAEDLGKMQARMNEMLGHTSPVYVYPYGKKPKDGDALCLRTGARITLSCEEKVSRISRDPESLLSLGRFNRPYGIESAQFLEKVLKSIES